ncbi:MAG: hypothetical protein AAGF12_13860 [Myxococcota bacterium]
MTDPLEALFTLRSLGLERAKLALSSASDDLVVAQAAYDNAKAGLAGAISDPLPSQAANGAEVQRTLAFRQRVEREQRRRRQELRACLQSLRASEERLREAEAQLRRAHAEAEIVRRRRDRASADQARNDGKKREDG